MHKNLLFCLQYWANLLVKLRKYLHPAINI
nr:MAG TPA_asm: hypothetical protein [Caudoviricetes sp.]